MSAVPLVPGVGRIAVLRANGVGDFLMIVPALECLRAAYPDAEITVIGDAWLAPFLEGRPGPWDQAVVAPHYPGLRGLPAAAEPGDDLQPFLDEHGGAYDLVLQMHGGGRSSNGFVRLLRPGLAVGPRTSDAVALDRWVPYLDSRHEALRWLEVAALAGADNALSVDRLTARLGLTEGDLAESRSVWPGDEPFVMFHAGFRDPRRQWSVENFIELGRRLFDEHGLQVVLIGSEHDADVSAKVAAALPGHASDVTRRLSLSGLLGLASRATLFVGNDSGPRHLAIAVRTPSVGIFWVGNLLSFGPLSGSSERTAVSYRTRCPVCGQEQVRHRCDHDVSFVDDISVDEVYAEAAAALQGGAGS
jgi:ADP-heptose:LPS heptosyltransferase